MVNVAGTAASSLSLMGKKKNAFFYINSSSPSSCSLYLTFLFFTGQKTIGNVAGYLVFFFLDKEVQAGDESAREPENDVGVALTELGKRGTCVFT